MSIPIQKVSSTPLDNHHLIQLKTVWKMYGIIEYLTDLQTNKQKV